MSKVVAEEKPQSAPQDASEVLIQGKLYDVTSFKHPGGSIIKYLTGEGDATEAFVEFHMRSEKAERMLKSLPCRDAPAEVLKKRANNGKPQLAKDFALLRKKFVEEGIFDPSLREIAYRLGELAAMHVIGAYLLMQPTFSTFVRFLGILTLAIAQGRCGWLMHEAGHYSLTGYMPIDRAIQIFVYGAGCGMSGMWWRNQHNKHHATPQKLKHDVDLDTLPLVAFNKAIVASPKLRQNKLLCAWLGLQGYLFMPLSCLLVALTWQLLIHPRHIVRTMTSSRAPRGYSAMAAGEAASIIFRYLVIFGYVLSGMSFSNALGVYLLYDLLASIYIFTNFSLSHTHLPVSGANEYLHWVEYSAHHTINLSPNWLCNWWMGYLNFQIEHHLFPSMPQFRQPLISPRVRAMFEKNGIKYDSRPYFSALAQTLSNLNEVGAYVNQNPRAKGA
eukprot:c9810_g1_i1.p1 GENE.c9810_g1_i1~~c9810_g1_i1.p1  ORF type:complete len:465 (+),score=91.21 c9810_g1_i1:64-1395(+)